ncbi:hypothetical protein J6590_094177 [Homalodisca vitripennis]|nr:hypothetical protein J6590_094177 [Homalodisca vitripennis]
MRGGSRQLKGVRGSSRTVTPGYELEIEWRSAMALVIQANDATVSKADVTLKVYIMIFRHAQFLWKARRNNIPEQALRVQLLV